MERKLSKSHALQTNLSTSIGKLRASNRNKYATKISDYLPLSESIIGEGQPPLALRLSSQLLLGIVRIYGKKNKYLIDDCNEVLLRLRTVSGQAMLSVCIFLS